VTIIRGKNGPKIEWLALIVSLVIALPASLWLVRDIREPWARVLIAGSGAFVLCGIVQVILNQVRSRRDRGRADRNDPEHPGRPER